MIFDFTLKKNYTNFYQFLVVFSQYKVRSCLFNLYYYFSQNLLFFLKTVEPENTGRFFRTPKFYYTCSSCLDRTEKTEQSGQSRDWLHCICTSCFYTQFKILKCYCMWIENSFFLFTKAPLLPFLWHWRVQHNGQNSRTENLV